MMNEQDQQTAAAEKFHSHTHYNPVDVSDTLGVIFLGILGVILLIALLRAQARIRELMAQGSRQTDVD